MEATPHLISGNTVKIPSKLQTTAKRMRTRHTVSQHAALVPPFVPPRVRLLSVKPSPIARYKLRAEWSDGSHTDFGATGYSDYTIHKDIQRRRLYRVRHGGDRITEPKTAGALSWYLLWGESTLLKTNIRSFKRLFETV